MGYNTLVDGEAIFKCRNKEEAQLYALLINVFYYNCGLLSFLPFDDDLLETLKNEMGDGTLYEKNSSITASVRCEKIDNEEEYYIVFRANDDVKYFNPPMLHPLLFLTKQTELLSGEFELFGENFYDAKKIYTYYDDSLQKNLLSVDVYDAFYLEDGFLT